MWRDLLFVCDEYHAFATVGETDPTGDERTFALSRQARLIPIVATQSISSLRSVLPGDESWRTLLQCFRNKVFLATSDEFTARNAADLCGRKDRLKAHYSLSESGRDAHVSLLTGRAAASKQSITATKSYAPTLEHIFAPRVFTELQNAQAIVLPYDGVNPLPPQFCYLKPHYLDVQTSYFEHLGERCAMSSLDRILPFLRPIEDLLRDPAVTEVMVNCGGRRVFVERSGALELVPERSLEVRNLTVAIKNIARACGDEISEAQPALDARLEDGSRVAAMFPPCAVDGPTLTVRKFTHRYTLNELVECGTLSLQLAAELTDAVRRRRNVLISGGTGTGKTTLLNALASTIPPEDRIVLIEETSEILIDKPNLVRFEARRSQAPLGQEAPLPAVTIADLLRATLRHRPDRILVGEVRGAEAFDLLQALNTGHQGALSTIHANSAEQALARLAHCVLTANTGLPHHSTREAIALAIHLVVHIERVGRTRTVTDVATVSGYDTAADRIRLEPVEHRGGGHKGRSDRMSRIPAWARPVPLLLVLWGCGDSSPGPTGPSPATSFLSGHVDRDGHDPGQPRRPEPAAAERRTDAVDLRGNAADEPAVVPNDRAIGSSVADDDDHRHDCADARQHAARADQHARRVHVATRMPRHVRERRDRSGHSHRGELHGNGLPAGDVRRPARVDQELTEDGRWRSTSRRRSDFSTPPSGPTTGSPSCSKSHDTGGTAQRVGPLSLIAEREVSGVAARGERRRFSVFVSVNAIRPQRKARTRDAIGEIRHVFLDADRDGPAVLAAIAARRDLPPPSYVLHSSPNRLHVLWRVSGFTKEGVEALQKQLARELGTDKAATSCAQITRLPGFFNHKYRPAPWS